MNSRIIPCISSRTYHPIYILVRYYRCAARDATYAAIIMLIIVSGARLLLPLPTLSQTSRFIGCGNSETAFRRLEPLLLGNVWGTCTIKRYRYLHFCRTSNGAWGGKTANRRYFRAQIASTSSEAYEAPLGVTYVLGVLPDACTRTPLKVRLGAKGCDL